MNVRITDDTAEAAAEAATAAGRDAAEDPTAAVQSSTAATRMVKICTCGAVNPANARKCTVCGEDLSDILPVPLQDTEKPCFVLKSIDDLETLRIDGTVVVGRENAMRDYLMDRKYVSRTHARLSVEDGKLYIENLSRTNYTFVNNVRIREKTELHAGDEIGLGGNEIDGRRQSLAAYFLVDTAS